MQPFEPLVLNDETVQAIYDRCLANDDTLDEDRVQSMAFLGVCGYARDVFQKVFFSRARMPFTARSMPNPWLYPRISLLPSIRSTLTSMVTSLVNGPSLRAVPIPTVRAFTYFMTMSKWYFSATKRRISAKSICSFIVEMV